MPKTRTFIAVEALDEVNAAAMSAIDALRPVADAVRWVEPDNLHWTVQFLGDLDDREMAEVCLRTVRAAARHKAFELEAWGVGAFPSIQRPRTIWLGAGQGAAEFIALQADLEDDLRALGFRADGRPFVPHLTLGRAASSRPHRGGSRGAEHAAADNGGAASALSKTALTDALAPLHDYDGGRMSVDQLIVFASDLTPDGPVYSVLARAPLG